MRSSRSWPCTGVLNGVCKGGVTEVALERGSLPVKTNENGTVQAIVAGGLAAEGIQEVVLSAEEAAARRLAQLVSPETIDRIVAGTKKATRRETGRGIPGTARIPRR